jgi:hypothetical protein
MSRQTPQSEIEMKRQLDEAILQYQAITQTPPPQQSPQNIQINQTVDYLGDIDRMVSELDKDVALKLSSDSEYIKIQEDLQKMIQEEMLKSIRWKINSNQVAISKMERLKEIIVSAKKAKTEEDRKIMSDLNDYVKNYSDLTFEEYKQLKYGK